MPRSISGRVTGANGAPLPGITVVTRPTETGGKQSGSGSATTGVDGRYRLTGIPPGEYRVNAWSYVANPQTGVSERRAPPPSIDADGVRRGYVTTSYRALGGSTQVPSVVRVDKVDIDGVDIQMERRPVFDVHGVVSGPISPEGLKPLMVTLQRITTDSNDIAFGRRAAVENGRFVIEDLRDGTYDITLPVGPQTYTTRVTINGRNPPPVVISIK